VTLALAACVAAAVALALAGFTEALVVAAVALLPLVALVAFWREAAFVILGERGALGLGGEGLRACWGIAK